MLKKRVMGVVIVRGGVAVQSFDFRRYLPVGKPQIVVDFLNTWGIDEIAVIDIDAWRTGAPNLTLVQTLSSYCRVPLTYGGGIKTARDMTSVIQAGADKLMINGAFYANPSVVTEGAELLGSQCIVVSIDALRKDGQLTAASYRNAESLPSAPDMIARQAEELGAGEIFLNSIDRDGSKRGFDLGAARLVSDAVSLPVTICGGAGIPEHFAEGLEIPNVSAVAAANYFNFSEHSVTVLKQHLNQKHAARLRHDTYFDYAGATVDQRGRLLKKEDEVLKEMLFEYHPVEVI